MKVVITGTSQGIGKELASKFLREGHEVHGIDIQLPCLDHPKYKHWVADVASPSEYGTLPNIENVEVLINNAGTQESPSINGGRKDMGVNFWGTLHCTEKYGIQPAIKSIINIASASAHSGAEFPVYAASKGAVLTYTRQVAGVVAQWGATCNSVSPGAVITGMNEHILKNPKMFEAVANESMLKKWATAEEIAEWVYFLAVHNYSMTAQDLLIDNGEMARQNFIW